MSAQFFLASRSPRRRQLLEQLGLRFDVIPADIPEQPQPGQAAADYVMAMARGKAQVAAAFAPQLLPLLGSDTEVVIDGEILGKPRDREHGIAQLLRLSGRVHQVYSGVVVQDVERCESALSITDVHFAEISPEQAARYWQTGEPADKAGGYAIQGLGACFVREIRGSYSGVMGLPLFETQQLLQCFGINVLSAPTNQKS